MFIKAYEKIQYPSRISLLERELANNKPFTFIGYYEEMDDCFYLLNGSYELEAAYRAGLTITLINCDMEDKLHYSDIGFDEMLLTFKGERVFNKRGFASFMNILEAIPAFSGKEYIDEEFAKVEISDFAQFKK